MNQYVSKILVFILLLILFPSSSNLFGIKRRKISPKQFSQIPDDCLHIILCFLPWNKVVVLALLNKEWNNLIFGENGHFKKRNLRKDIPHVKIEDNKIYLRIKNGRYKRLELILESSFSNSFEVLYNKLNKYHCGFGLTITRRLFGSKMLDLNQDIIKHPNFVKLIISGDWYFPIDLANVSFRNLQNLRTLRIQECNNVNSSSILKLSNLRELILIGFSYEYPIDLANVSFENLKNLQLLKIEKCINCDCSSILKLSNLRELVFIGSSRYLPMDLANESFDNLKNLQSLEVWDCDNVNWISIKNFQKLIIFNGKNIDAETKNLLQQRGRKVIFL